MFITLDIGGTKMRAASFENSHTPEILDRMEQSQAATYDENISALRKMIQTLANGHAIEGIGIAIAGVLNQEGSELIKSANLHPWLFQPLKHDLQQSFEKVRVELANDAYCNALAEVKYGETKDNFLLLIWGTGVGGAIVEYRENTINIQPTEIGHQILEYGGRLCGCGQNGCLEQYAGGGPLRKRFGFTLQLEPDQWEEVIQKLAQGLVNVLAIHPVTTLVWSGGMTIHFSQKLEGIQHCLEDQLSIHPMPEFRICEFGDDIGLIGALGLFKE